MQTDNIEKHQEYQQLAISAYPKNKELSPKNWVELSSEKNWKTGFRATAFYKNNQIVIAISGTDSPIDILDSDIKIGLNKIPNQFYDAKKFYEKIKKNNPDTKITFVGHSLGGSLSQLMSNETGCDAVTFNAYGVKNIIGEENNKNTNIINYGNPKDKVFRKNLDNQLGKTFIIDDLDNSDIALKTQTNSPQKQHILKHHPAENMGDIRKAKEYKTYLTGSVSKSIGEPDLDINRIFTKNDIDKMNKDEFSKKEGQIFNQIKTYGIPTEKQAQEEVKNGNLIWVDDYKRDDGTPVQGYYRRKSTI